MPARRGGASLALRLEISMHPSLPHRATPRTLIEAGPQALSDGELLAIVLGTGTRWQSAAELARALLIAW